MQRKNKKMEKAINGKKFKIALVVARFNEDITGGLLNGAQDILIKNNILAKNIKIIWVPGSFEIPLACQKLAATKKYDAIVALGAVIKGATDHYYYISSEVSRGIMDVSLKFSIPVGFGVITVENLKQAKDRCEKKNNKGGEAMSAVLEMLSLSY